MKKTLRVFPLLLSLLLLLGHQLVPHLHEAPVEEVCIGHAESADLGWLSLVFSLDQGAEHLEHFRQLSDSEEHLDLQQIALPAFTAVALALPPAFTSLSHHIPVRQPIACYFIARAHQLRGPPSC